MLTLFERTEGEIALRDARIAILQERVDSIENFASLSGRLAREIALQYPEVSEVFLARGSAVSADSLKTNPKTGIIIRLSKPMSEKDRKKLTEWLSVRLDEPDAEIFIRQ